MRLKTFGGAVLEGTSLRRPQLLLLMAYLAVEGTKNRQELRDLFWSQARDPAGNLRFTLSQIRAAVPRAVREDGQRLTLTLPTDTAELVQVFRSAPEQVLSIYQGPFLDGMKVEGEELEDWLLLTREHYAAQVRTSLIGQAVRLAQGSMTEEGRGQVSELLRRAWKLPGASPLDADELSTLHDLATLIGDEISGALRQEAAEIDLPLRVTRPPDRTDSGSPGLLPQHATSFIGRSAELAELRELLDDSQTRLLTLLGTGGIGKTRLTLELGRLISPRKVVYVDLQEVDDPTLVPNLMALALGVKPGSTVSALEVLKGALQDSSVVMLLDNFEQVLPAGEALTSLLDACPGVQFVVTSRERLAQPAEVLYPLDGLNFEGQDCEAVDLFVSRARRANARFRLSPANAPVVVDICRRVEGSPLGIELAAAWLRSVPVEQIAAELQQGVELLEDTAGKERRSLRAIFDQSWQRLSEKERDLLTGLSLFRGGFTRADAQQVLDVPLRILLGLVDAALLRLTPQGRYMQHPLLQHFAREKLGQDPARKATLEQTFTLYFCQQSLSAWHAYYSGKDQQGQADWGRDEYDNLQAAMEYAEVRSEIGAALDVSRFHSREWINRGLMAQGVSHLTRLLALDGDPTAAAYRWGCLTRVQLQVNLGVLTPEFMGQLEETVTLARAANDQACLAEALNVSGIVRAYGGEFEEAITLLREAASAGKEAGHLYGQVVALTNLGAMYGHLHRLKEALAMLDMAFALIRSSGLDSLMAGMAIMYGQLQANMGAYDAAEESLELAHEVFSRLRSQRDLGFVALIRGINELWREKPSVAVVSGRFDRARAYFEESQRLMEPGAIGQEMDLLRPGVGDVLLGQRDWMAARLHYEAALNEGKTEGGTAAMMNAHFGLGRVEHGEGSYRPALEHFRQMLDLTRDNLVRLDGLDIVAGTVSRMGGWKLAASVWGATGAFRDQTGLVRQPYFAESDDVERQWTQARLGEQDFNLALSEGRNMTLEQAAQAVEGFSGEQGKDRVEILGRSVQDVN